MVEGVRRSAGRETGAAHFSVSSTGSLIYIPGPVSASARPMWNRPDGSAGRGGNAEASAWSVRRRPASLRTARASPLGAMTAKRRSSIRMSCPATTGMQATHVRREQPFPIWSSDAKRVAFQSDRDGDSGHLLAARRWRRRRSPHEARTWRITCAGVVVSEGRPASVQRHEGIRRVVVDVLAAGQKGDAVRRGPLVVSHRRACFRPMDDGWPTRARNGARRRSTSSHSQPREPSISFPRKRPTFPMKWSGHRTERNCFTCRGSADSRPSPSRPSRVWLRESRGGAETAASFWDLPTREPSTTSHQGESSWFLSVRDEQRRERPRLPKSRWSSIGSKS